MFCYSYTINLSLKFHLIDIRICSLAFILMNIIFFPLPYIRQIMYLYCIRPLMYCYRSIFTLPLMFSLTQSAALGQFIDTNVHHFILSSWIPLLAIYCNISQYTSDVLVQIYNQHTLMFRLPQDLLLDHYQNPLLRYQCMYPFLLPSTDHILQSTLFITTLFASSYL